MIFARRATLNIKLPFFANFRVLLSSNGNKQFDQLDKKQENKEKMKKNSQLVLDKLNKLLGEISMTDSANSRSQIILAKPRTKRIKVKQERSEGQSDKSSADDTNIKAAVREVAQNIGGDPKHTESELLAKLLENDKEISPITNLSDIFKGMKIDRTQKLPESYSRSQEVKQVLRKSASASNETPKLLRKARQGFPKRRVREVVMEKIDLFGFKSLGIFTLDASKSEGPVNETWQALNSRELKLTVTHPPSNYFQQMISWTEQGKIWRFPIDNEQGLEKEREVYFADHIFLEKFLEGWCPPKGPIRHFMELVCVGLSKNFYLTVEAKKEHIEWYKNYFEDKQRLLKEIGALSEQKKLNSKEIDV